MSEVSESKDMQLEKSGEIRNPGIPETDRPKIPETKDGRDTNNTPFQPDTDIYNDIFKKSGLISENSESQENESQSDSGENDTDYSEHLEKGEDGKYYDKETGKAYDSVDQWVKEQETLAKRYEGTAKYYEDKAKKEWARFKNAEQNGETDAEKWEHYRKSQEYYAKAKECKEKAQRIREKLGQTNNDTTEALKYGETNLAASFDAVPAERKEIVKNAFENAPDVIKDIANRLEDVLQVQDGEPEMPSRYSPYENVIFMNPAYDNDEYAEVFLHEYGHFADIQLGTLSSGFDFMFGMDEDIEKLSSADVKEKMLDDLASTDAIFDRSVSDILSGAFLNDPEIQVKYIEEGAPFYSHPDEYWINGPINAREKETFANLFRIYSDPDRADSRAFVEKYFPNTCEAFKNSLSI